MGTWQLIVSICAGLITLFTLLDKIGLIKSVKKLSDLQKAQNEAQLAILRNELYKCFKEHRDYEAWTDDDLQVQTKMHEAYKRLGGNGEETVWWTKKMTWKICTEDQMRDLIYQHNRE